MALAGAAFITMLYLYKVKGIEDEVVNEIVKDDIAIEGDIMRSIATSSRAEADKTINAKKIEVEKKEEEKKNERLKLLEYLENQNPVN